MKPALLDTDILSLELSINNFTILNQCFMINVDFMFLSNSIT
jgi:hypothetical protein